jgi:hypothetical protein
MAQPIDSGSKAARLRSPAYPGINLETALKRAKEFHTKERRNSANVAVAVTHWGFVPTSGGAYIIVAALKSFGLFDDEGSGNERKVKLSTRGLRIILDEREDSPERAAAIKEAALAPTIHAKLWRKYGANLPSDANLRHELIFEWKFNENSVDSFIKEYRDTIRFAKLMDSDTISSGVKDTAEDDEEQNESGNALQVGDFVQWESQGILQFSDHKRVREVSSDGKWAFVDGSDTGVPVKELTVVEAPSSAAAVPPPASPASLPPRPRTMVESQTAAGQPPPTAPSGRMQDVFSLTEGPVTIQWPASLSAESYEDFSGWLDLLKRRVGRSVAKIEPKRD